MKTFVVEQMNILENNGFEISYICDMDDEFISTYSSKYKCYDIKMKRGLHFISALKAFFSIYSIFKKNKYDIIQYSTPNASLYASLAGWLAGIPIRLYCQWGLRYAGSKGFKKFFLKTFEKVTCSFSTHVRAVSHKNLDIAIIDRLYNKKKGKVIGKGGTIGVDIKKYDLLTRLDGMPKHTKVCHGDFNPRNIIVTKDKMYTLDWIHASQGNASADVARSFLLFALEDMKLAELYLDIFCKKSKTSKYYVQQWLPIVAAAQLTKNKEEEKELLLNWLDVREYE
jgi:hypothetical protein